MNNPGQRVLLDDDRVRGQEAALERLLEPALVGAEEALGRTAQGQVPVGDDGRLELAPAEAVPRRRLGAELGRRLRGSRGGGGSGGGGGSRGGGGG